MTLTEGYLRVIRARELQCEWDGLCIWAGVPKNSRKRCTVEAGPQGYYLDIGPLGQQVTEPTMGDLPVANETLAEDRADGFSGQVTLGATSEEASLALEAVFREMFPHLIDLDRTKGQHH